MALRPLHEERVYESYWQESHTLGVEAALWDGAIDVQAELRTQLASAREMLTLVSVDRLRELIRQTHAELDDDRGRDRSAPGSRPAIDNPGTGPGWRRRGDSPGSGRPWSRPAAPRRPLVLLTGAAPSGAHGDMARAAAYRALGERGPAMDAAEHATRHARYRLYGTALTLLAELAEEPPERGAAADVPGQGDGAEPGGRARPCTSGEVTRQAWSLPT